MDRAGWARGVASEISPTLRLAGPVVAAELGWMGMALVDTTVVGHLPDSAESIGAVSLGSVAFFTPAVFGMGMLLGLDTLVSRASGARDADDARRWLAQGVWLALGLAPLLMGVVLAVGALLPSLGVNPEVLRLARPYLHATNWSTLPLLLYAAFRRYLQAVGRVWPVLFALTSANVVNLLGDWALVFGRLGAPALGVTGSGWATTVSRTYMALVLVACVLWHERGRILAAAAGPPVWRPDPARLRRLVGLGTPAAVHVTLEVGVFALATALAARFEAAALAAHQIVLNVASVTFMVPLGLSSAGAVRVGRAIGAGDTPASARAGWAALALGTAFMAGSALVFAMIPRQVVAGFTDDARVLALGVPLMFVAAGFQLFDGVQGVTTGNLRGAGDTHTPMLALALAHWVIGLPLGYLLAFVLDQGVIGLWLGLSLGLAVAACLLLYAWTLRARDLTASRAARH